MQNSFWVVLAGVLFFSGVSFVGYLVINNNTNKSISNLISSQSEVTILPTPSPVPFYEVTIPYLREREYKSQLGTLEKVSENSSYTSYLTSYDSDGLKINGLLTQPQGEVPNGGWPAIVFIHGYIPPEQYQTLTRYADHVDSLSRNGFVVFKIDLRGHGNSQGEAGGAYFSADYVMDTLNAYAALQSSSFVNPQKIGLWGHSMAGNVAMRSFSVKPEIPAVVIWAGAVYSYIDLNEYAISDSSYQPPKVITEKVQKRQELLSTYGAPKDGNLFWKQVAPTSYLNDLKGAIQLNHAVNDDVVDIRYSRNLNQLLNATKVVHELHEYPSGGHNISGNGFTKAMQNTVEFFQKYLK